jgi:hypothetical protein
MAKTRNFKSHSLDHKSDLRLKSILKEVRNNTKSYLKKFSDVKYGATINETALNGILNSGVLSLDESDALQYYFTKKQIKTIDENTVRRIDEDMRIINEGWFDNAKNWLKSKKDDVVNALKSGWSGVKKIWSNFKDILTELAQKLKTVFMKLMEKVTGMIESAYTKLKSAFTQAWYATFSQKHEHDHSDLLSELKDLLACTKAIATGVKNKIVDGKEWVKGMIDGTVAPEENVKVDEKALEKGIDAVTEEGVQHQVKKMYERIFNDKNMLSELLLWEGHLEDAFKKMPNKIIGNVMYYVVKYGMLIVKAIISPATLIITKSIEYIAPKIFTFISAVSKAFQGPGIFEFAILTLMGVEVYEIIHNNHFATDPSTVTGMGREILETVLSFIPGLDVLFPILQGCAYAIMAYSLGTIIYNIASTWKAAKSKEGGEEGGEEPEVQTAGYKPKGSFKLKEGKLVFIQ